MRFKILLLSFLFMACAGLDELIQQGRYDQAIEKGLRMLYRTPNDHHTQKEVESAYMLAQNRDLEKVESLKEMDESAANWEKIYTSYLYMERRQSKLAGAKIEVKNDPFQKGDMEWALDNTCMAYVDKAEELMEQDLRKAYKAAYFDWVKIKKFGCSYEYLDSMMQTSLENGKAVVALQIDEQNGTHIPEKTEEYLENLGFESNGKLGYMVRYVGNSRTNYEIDYTVEVTFNQINVSKNQETKKSQVVSKRVVDHYDYKKDAQGKTIKVPVYKTLKATLKTVTQTKEASQGAFIRIYNHNESKTIYEGQLVGNYRYSYSYTTATGDQSILSKEQKRSLNKKKRSFPSNTVMINKSGKKLAKRVYSAIYNSRSKFL